MQLWLAFLWSVHIKTYCVIRIKTYCVVSVLLHLIFSKSCTRFWQSWRIFRSTWEVYECSTRRSIVGEYNMWYTSCGFFRTDESTRLFWSAMAWFSSGTNNSFHLVLVFWSG